MSIRQMAITALGCALLLTHVSTAVAQANNNRNRQNNNRNRQQNEVQLPDDERLLALHLQFVKDAEKLAVEYERDREYEKAKAVYGEIIRLVPQYRSAREKLDALRNREASAMREVFTVHADKDWQRTGIIVQAGKPIVISAEGTWTFTYRATLSPEGIEIPDDLKDFNLGSLVGFIDSGDPENQRPFEIGNGTSFVAERTGMLYLKMWDAKNQDNDGSLTVNIRGTFSK